MPRLHFCTIVVIAAIGTPSNAQKIESLSEKPIRAADKEHWSFQPPKRPSIPTIKQAGWIRTPVDAFVLAKLEAVGLTSSPPAEKLALLRRVHLDLVGLPPSPEEQEAYIADSSPDAFEKVVDRLLTSPHYGERWAQHWLDAVRFAESNGYEADSDRPNAWRYRDYVARSFNDDKSYDRFLTEQIAGDELAAGKDPRLAAELLIATGLHRCGAIHLISGNVDPEIVRQEMLTEYVQGIGAAVFGLTMNCARCHDHKFDPISQADYYRLEAFFAAAKFKEVDLATPEEKKARATQVSELEALIKPLRASVEAIDAPHRKHVQEAKRAKLEPMYRDALAVEPKKRTKEQEQLAKDAETLIKVTWDEIIADLTPEERAKREQLRAKQHELQAMLPPPTAAAWCVSDEGKPPPTHVLRRGELKKKGAVVEPAYPRILVGADAPPEREKRLTRTDFAKWITQPDNPLTARVFVNRIWQHHFGRGIVNTPNDFGIRGELPTHPELLDWLTTEFVANGWQLKPIHRMIVLSNTYRQASNVKASEQAKKVDPDNRLLWRMNRRRLDGEAIRDCMLAAAGTLTRQIGGPSVRVPLEPEVYDLIFTEGEPDGLWNVTPDLRQHTRRSLYLLTKRNVRLPMLEAFDQPDRLSPCAGRAVSTFAPQALIQMNGPFAQTHSRAMSASLLREFGVSVDSQISQAYRRAFGRTPSGDEVRTATEFLKGQAELAKERLLARLPAGVPDGLPPDADAAHAVALADFCLALFNANEFVYGP
jgi:hypothetical protein